MNTFTYRKNPTGDLAIERNGVAWGVIKGIRDIMIVTLEGNEWVTHNIGPHAEEIIDLFGTNRIPTSFLAGTSGSFVLAQLRELNPTCDILIAR